MVVQKVNKQIRELIKGRGWEHIENALKSRRDKLVISILQGLHSDEKIYTQSDVDKLSIKMLNGIINVPSLTVEVDEEVDIESKIEEGETLEIGAVGDLFKQPNQE